MKLSILVPIYNVEKYLSECLDSLIAQTLNEIEIICINDGSNDNSLKIIKKYAKKDTRIVIINKKNSGYGDSMNQGLAKARGEYIAIVESDDFAEPEMCEKLYSLAKKNQADIVRANYFYHTKKGDEIHYAIREQKLEVAMDILDNTAILLEEPAIWSAIYRREFLLEHKIGFLTTPGASYQDTSFNLKALCSARLIVYTDEAFLHYRTDNSGSSVKSVKKVDFVRQEFAEVDKFLTKNRASLKIQQLVQVAKFGAYHWNVIRLPRKSAIEFLGKMRAEFYDLKTWGLIKREYFPKKYWFALQMILHCPASWYYAILRLRNQLKT